MMSRTPPSLYCAIYLWRHDRELPMTLYAELVDLGYDVPALERALLADEAMYRG